MACKIRLAICSSTKWLTKYSYGFPVFLLKKHAWSFLSTSLSNFRHCAMQPTVPTFLKYGSDAHEPKSGIKSLAVTAFQMPQTIYCLRQRKSVWSIGQKLSVISEIYISQCQRWPHWSVQTSTLYTSTWWGCLSRHSSPFLKDYLDASLISTVLFELAS
jgi:hypothetical protein